jgi:hypothetical protein
MPRPLPAIVGISATEYEIALQPADLSANARDGIDLAIPG